MENLNRVLLENVLPAHVAEHFLARNWKNEVGHVNNVLFIYLFITLKKKQHAHTSMVFKFRKKSTNLMVTVIR